MDASAVAARQAMVDSGLETAPTDKGYGTIEIQVEDPVWRGNRTSIGRSQSWRTTQNLGKRHWYYVNGAVIKDNAAVCVYDDQTCNSDNYRDFMETHFAKVRDEFKDALSRAEYLDLQRKFTHFGTSGGDTTYADSSISCIDLAWAYDWLDKQKAENALRTTNGSLANAGTDGEATKGRFRDQIEAKYFELSKQTLIDIASLSGKPLDLEKGFDFHDFVLLFCKTFQRPLPEAINAALDKRLSVMLDAELQVAGTDTEEQQKVREKYKMAVDVKASTWASEHSVPDAVEFMKQTADVGGQPSKLKRLHGQGWFYRYRPTVRSSSPYLLHLLQA